MVALTATGSLMALHEATGFGKRRVTDVLKHTYDSQIRRCKYFAVLGILMYLLVSRAGWELRPHLLCIAVMLSSSCMGVCVCCMENVAHWHVSWSTHMV